MPLLVVMETPPASGRGSFPMRFHAPSGFSRANTESYQTFVPPSHSFLPGKFVPPATTSAPPFTPAYG
jgi:hypothetical protein